MALKVVLVEPVIPQNTGNIARLTAATRVELHLIQPLGFELSDRYLKRAGLDYWPEVQLTVHESWERFCSAAIGDADRLHFLSTHATRGLFQQQFQADDWLVFGNEVAGLAASFHERYREQMLRIPMENPNVRSLNLANAVAIVLFEARRQTLFGEQ